MAHRYSNLDPRHRPHGFGAVYRWAVRDRLTGRRRVAPPGQPAPRVEPDLGLIHEDSDRNRLTWIGHASFLLQIEGLSILIDPVFADRLGWVYRRYGKPGLVSEQLPAVAAALVSHNHYDHLDVPSLRALAVDALVIVPSGLGGYLGSRLPQKLTELGWWQSVSVGGVDVTLVPSRHWSRRRIFDTNHSHWGGFVIEAPSCSVYFAGDTAWFEGFAAIGARFPDLSAAILPIGGYQPAWFMEHNHLNPEQAGEAFRLTGARRLVPGHWGAFQLTDEPLCEPVERLRAWWQGAIPPLDGKTLSVLAVGETILLED